MLARFVCFHRLQQHFRSCQTPPQSVLVEQNCYSWLTPKRKKNGHNINFREHMIRNTWMKAHVSAMRYMLSGLGHRPVGIGERLH